MEKANTMSKMTTGPQSLARNSKQRRSAQTLLFDIIRLKTKSYPCRGKGILTMGWILIV
jgi:hypothetical protein